MNVADRCSVSNYVSLAKSARNAPKSDKSEITKLLAGAISSEFFIVGEVFDVILVVNIIKSKSKK